MESVQVPTECTEKEPNSEVMVIGLNSIVRQPLCSKENSFFHSQSQLDALCKQFDTFEQLIQKRLTAQDELYRKSERDIAELKDTVVNLQERLANKALPIDPIALKERIDFITDSLIPSDKMTPDTPQMRTNIKARRQSYSKRKSRPLSEYDTLPRTNSVSSSISSGYKSIDHQDSSDSPNLESINETVDPTQTQLLPQATSTPVRQQTDERLSNFTNTSMHDLQIIKDKVVETLWAVSDLIGMLSNMKVLPTETDNNNTGQKIA